MEEIFVNGVKVIIHRPEAPANFAASVSDLLLRRPLNDIAPGLSVRESAKWVKRNPNG